MNDFKIRSAALADAAPIAGLMSQLGYATTAGEMKERLAAILRESAFLTLVADQRSEVIGMIGAGVFPYYEKNGNYGRILALVVDEKRKGQGVGARRVGEIETRLKAFGATALVVNSDRQRIAAHRFYERHGFTATGLRFVKTLA